MYKQSKIIFSEEQLDKRIKEVAAQIHEDYKDKEKDGIVVVGVLNGAYVFMADLVRYLDLDLEIDFIQASSYQNSTVSSGNVKIEKDLTTILDSKHVIVVEDIIETGNTLNHIKNLFKDRRAKSVKICALLVKDYPVAHELADYMCFDCPNEFIVGYGLDYAQKYRNLPYITSLEKQETD